MTVNNQVAGRFEGGHRVGSLDEVLWGEGRSGLFVSLKANGLQLLNASTFLRFGYIGSNPKNNANTSFF